MSTCSGCSEQWTGLAACHCRACHVTKDDLAAWDKHRTDGECSRRQRENRSKT